MRTSFLTHFLRNENGAKTKNRSRESVSAIVSDHLADSSKLPYKHQVLVKATPSFSDSPTQLALWCLGLASSAEGQPHRMPLRTSWPILTPAHLGNTESLPQSNQIQLVSAIMQLNVYRGSQKISGTMALTFLPKLMNTQVSSYDHVKN